MTLQELFNLVVLESGQFMLADSSIELNIDRFKLIVDVSLGQYNRYIPHEIYLHKNLTNRSYTFTEENTSDGIPDWISDVVPTRIFGTYPFYYKKLFGNPLKQQFNANLIDKTPFVFTYRKPVLYVQIDCELDITAAYHHKFKESIDPNTSKKTYELPTITPDNVEFIQLVQAKFLKGLGRSRRAFTIGEIPLLTDASELVSEGLELENTLLTEKLSDMSKFYLAW